MFFIQLKLLVLVVIGTILISDVSSYPAENGLHSSTISCALYGQLGQGYYMQTFIGDPQQSMNVLIDTGSSNFAIAAAPHKHVDFYYNTSRSSTLKKLDKEIYVPYTEGSWKGFIGTDIIRFSNQSDFRVDIAFITDSTEFFIAGSHWQGILGLAYSAIAKPDSSIEPFFDSMVSNLGCDDVFAIQLCGVVGSTNTTNYNVSGTLTLGGVESARYVSELHYIPLLHEWFYEIVITNISVGKDHLGLECSEYNNDKTIVDSGTTDLRLPTSVYDAVLASLKKNTKDRSVTDGFWRGTDVLCTNRSLNLWRAFPALTLSLTASSSSYIDLVVAPSQYIRGITESEGKDGGITVASGQKCYKLAISKSESGTVLGAILMEGFYVVFDRRNKRIGFAQTSCGNDISDGRFVSRVEGPFHTSEDTSKCVHVQSQPIQAKDIVVYVILSILLACLVGLVVGLVHSRMRRLRQPSPSNSGEDVGNLLMERD